MPIILSPDAYEPWMDPSETDSERALALSEDKDVTAVEFFRVSSRVSNSRNEGAELLEPFPNPA